MQPRLAFITFRCDIPVVLYRITKYICKIYTYMYIFYIYILYIITEYIGKYIYIYIYIYFTYIQGY